jgi:hypothetical protein
MRTVVAQSVGRMELGYGTFLMANSDCTN